MGKVFIRCQECGRGDTDVGEQIKTKKQYVAALRSVSKLMNANRGSTRGVRLDRLVERIVQYEKRQYPEFAAIAHGKGKLSHRNG